MAKKKKAVEAEAEITGKTPTTSNLVKKVPVHAEGTMIMCDDGAERTVLYRDTAIAQGLNRYFTGEKCNNGHVAERKVKGYICTTCARVKMKARHKRKLESDPQYKAKVAERRREKHKERYANDPDYKQHVLAKAKARRARRAAEKKEKSA